MKPDSSIAKKCIWWTRRRRINVEFARTDTLALRCFLRSVQFQFCLSWSEIYRQCVFNTCTHLLPRRAAVVLLSDAHATCFCCARSWTIYSHSCAHEPQEKPALWPQHWPASVLTLPQLAKWNVLFDRCINQQKMNTLGSRTAEDPHGNPVR